MTGNQMDIEYRIDFSERRKTVGIVIERNGEVVVKAPLGYSEEKIAALVNEKKMLIYSKINHPQKVKIQNTAPLQVHGRSVLYLGKYHKTQVNKKTQGHFGFTGKFIISADIKDQFEDRLKNWYQEMAIEKLIPRVKIYATRLGVEFNKIMISDLQLRWGSCTPKNNINLNYRLIKAPAFVYNYIIVHELTHLLVSNHDPEFWQKVKTCFPKYEEAREWLKIHGDKLFES